ncbi:debranching enzyme 1 isoform X2 [Wolffia australiana]
MKIAVEGCMHGDLDNVYAAMQHLERVENIKIDLLICCGDFQAVRYESDLTSVNVLPKYRKMNSFWKYYCGEEIAPYPTIFIGGNHEASNYLWELYYGGWAAPNIYFLGYAGVVKFGDIRIGGLSGIFNPRHYNLGHYERPPYNESDIRSIYHVREYDVLKLMQIKQPIDIFISHDWPLGITDFGDSDDLIRKKPFFRREIEERSLGSRAAAQLLNKLKPPYWFSAHLHCKFPAVIQHGEDGLVTKFLALDKCLPRRQFLQILDIGSDPGPHELLFDEEWLAITHQFHSVFPLTRKPWPAIAPIQDQDLHQHIKDKLKAIGSKPFDFVRTPPSSGLQRNPQTESFLQFLELPYLLDATRETDAGPQEDESPMEDDPENGLVTDDVDEMEELRVAVE